MSVAPSPVTVIVPARNAASTIAAQLDALSRQDFDGDVEIIVADNGSVDGTVAVVDQWKDRLAGLRVVSAGTRPSVGRARNVAIGAASNERVLMCDADDVVDGAWVRTLADALGAAGLVAGGFADLVPPPASESPEAHPFVSGFRFLPGFSTASAGVLRSAWVAVGGFDEELHAGEDLDFAWRVQLAGFTLVDRPDAFVHYRIPSTSRARFRRSFRYGRFQPVLYRKFRSSGMQRQPLPRALGRLALLLVSVDRAFGPPSDRLDYCDEVGTRLGRIVGSAQTGVLFL